LGPARSSYLQRLVLALTILGLALYVMRATAASLGNPVTALAHELLGPVKGGITEVGRFVSQKTYFLLSWRSLVRENEELRAEVGRLRAEVAELTEYRLENERLKRLLQYRDAAPGRGPLVVARVIARDPGNWFGTVTIDRGSADAVRRNMTVVTPDGLVGRVVAVRAHTSDVLLITDPRSSVGGLIQETRIPGVVEGLAGGFGLLRMLYIAKDAPVEVGQTVITSGLGGLFPKGIPVGTVAEVRPEGSGLFQVVVVRPFAQLNRLEEVAVLLGTGQ
jgi:rod shape-determining protein MreC